MSDDIIVTGGQVEDEPAAPPASDPFDMGLLKDLVDQSIRNAIDANYTPRQLAAALIAMAEQAKVAGDLPDADYHAVVIPDAGPHSLKSFPALEPLLEFLRDLSGTDVKVRVFYGRACPITRPPARYLLTHEGKFPLFKGLDDDAIDETGAMTGLVPVISIPTTPAKPAEQEDDDVDDDEGEEDDDEPEDDD